MASDYEKVAQSQIDKRNIEKMVDSPTFKRVQTKKTVKLKLTEQKDIDKYVELAIAQGGLGVALSVAERMEARDNYLAYLKLTTQSFQETRLAVWLAGKVDEWVRAVEKDTTYAYLSMPRQHGKSMVITERLPSLFCWA